MNSKPHTFTALSCGINSITTKRSRLIYQSSGEFFNILFAQLFCRQFLYLTRHLPPLPLRMNYNPHSQGPSLRNQSNSQKRSSFIDHSSGELFIFYWPNLLAENFCPSPAIFHHSS
jgi:hypothetical protein